MPAVGSDRVDAGAAAAAAATANAVLQSNAPPPFLSKTYDIVDDPATDAAISWGPQNNSFVVWNVPEFSRVLLPKFFKHSNFSSFVRQLNTYGFRKVDPDRWEFANEGFLRGQKHLLRNINRRKPSQAHSQEQQPQALNVSSAACVEVGKFGMEGEIEMLKRDKNVLMQELVRLRQQQQAADNQLDILGKRLHGMEHRQQMMMSFLAKAMQSPGLFTQLVQQNESNRHIVGVKKRRLPRQDESAAPDGQIVKYEPLMNGSPSAMLAQMLKFDSSPKLDEPMNNFPSHGGNSLDQNSGVTLADVPQNSGVHPFVPATSAFPSACSSSASSHEIQSEAGITDITIPDALQDIDMLSEVPVAIPCEFPEIQEFVSDEGIADIPIDGMYLHQIAEEVDGPMPIMGTNDDQKFSEIMDSLLEEFISSPQSGETKELVSSVQEPGSRWENGRNMDNLTAQMGLLASDSKV